MRNHFELFGIEPAFALDEAALERAYREIQSRIHPDRHARAGDAERRASMQWATRANEAYRTLRNPLARARYLLELHGAAGDIEHDTAMPADFLVSQMELRESLEQAARARDPAQLDALAAGIDAERGALLARVGERIDVARDYPGALDLVKKLMFLERLADEVQLAHEALEA